MKNNKLTILFFRDFLGFTGGHLKVWDYFQHIESCKNLEPKIYFTSQSIWENNPWSDIKNRILGEWEPEKADILFLAGMDWLSLPEKDRQQPPAPIINLIQHVRHADETNPLYKFLKYPATRICVSQEVSDVLNDTGIVNGSIITNPNGLNATVLPQNSYKLIPILIVGIKSPILAVDLSNLLSVHSIKHTVLTKPIPRNEFLSLLGKSKIAVFLPNKTEGFYLPALEAMRLKTLVICPDCIGNRGFCINKSTCFVPGYSLEEIKQSLLYSLGIKKNEWREMIDFAYKLSTEYTLEKERKIFLEVVQDVSRVKDV